MVIHKMGTHTSAKKRTLKAFTLVEMLIVVVIIGILAAALIPRLIGAQEGTRDVARKKGVSDIVGGLSVKKMNDGIAYPSGSECLSGGSSPSANTISAKIISGADSTLNAIPANPSANIPGVVVQTCKGGYGYRALKKRGIENESFVVGAGMEKERSFNITQNDLENKEKHDEVKAEMCEGDLTKCDPVADDNKGGYIGLATA